MPAQKDRRTYYGRNCCATSNIRGKVGARRKFTALHQPRQPRLGRESTAAKTQTRIISKRCMTEAEGRAKTPRIECFLFAASSIRAAKSQWADDGVGRWRGQMGKWHETDGTAGLEKDGHDGKSRSDANRICIVCPLGRSSEQQQHESLSFSSRARA